MARPALTVLVCTNHRLRPQNTITLPPGVQLPPGAVIVKNEQGQYMVVSGQQQQQLQQQQQHIQQHQPNTSAILSQQYKFNTVRVCITVDIGVDKRMRKYILPVLIEIIHARTH